MRDEEERRYEDIIWMPHHVSEKHPQMALVDRAAQFSPFAALTGYDAAIEETERITDNWLELSDSSKEILDGKLKWIEEHIAERPEAEFTCFVPDERKEGGAYVRKKGKVKRIDRYERRIIMEGGESVEIEKVVEINGWDLEI